MQQFSSVWENSYVSELLPRKNLWMSYLLRAMTRNWFDDYVAATGARRLESSLVETGKSWLNWSPEEALASLIERLEE